jgi:hypothetical protein
MVFGKREKYCDGIKKIRLFLFFYFHLLTTNIYIYIHTYNTHRFISRNGCDINNRKIIEVL